MNDEMSNWARPSEADDTDSLSHMLSYARQNYASHTDWYLRHRDTGIKILGIVLGANLTIAGLYFDRKLHFWLTVSALAILGILSLMLTRLAVRSCRQSYQAAMENALLVSKTAWAMGFGQSVPVESKFLKTGKCPVRADYSLYVPRYLKEAQEAESTDEFVSHQIRKRGTTYHAAKWTLWTIGGMALSLSVGVIIAASLLR